MNSKLNRIHTAEAKGIERGPIVRISLVNIVTL
jgi:hypothetical protein